jgi:hypothetical protein
MAESAQLTVTIPKSHQHHLGPILRAVLAHAPTHPFKAPFDRSDLQLELWPGTLDGFLPLEAREVTTDYFMSRVTRDRSGPIMPTHHSTLRIQQDNHMVSNLFSELPERLFRAI